MTQPTRFQFTSTDGLSVACVKWVRPQHVRGVVQIAHGLGEHMGRYAELAETLLEDELAVYGNDHRGHARESRTFCWGTAWVRSQRSNLFSITVIQLMAWCCQVLAHSTA